jgi:hypothetical protein
MAGVGLGSGVTRGVGLAFGSVLFGVVLLTPCWLTERVNDTPAIAPAKHIEQIKQIRSSNSGFSG